MLITEAREDTSREVSEDMHETTPVASWFYEQLWTWIPMKVFPEMFSHHADAFRRLKKFF